MSLAQLYVRVDIIVTYGNHLNDLIISLNVGPTKLYTKK
jgi:hypothetical protein